MVADTSGLLMATANQVHRAHLLAACKTHSGACLQAVPMHSLGLQLDSDAVRVALGLCRGAQVCESHRSRCGQTVDCLGHHGLSSLFCRFSDDRLPRHGNLNDAVKRGLATTGVPSVLEPGRRPDGLTGFPYRGDRSLIWDVTWIDTFAATKVVESTLEPDSAARAAQTTSLRGAWYRF